MRLPGGRRHLPGRPGDLDLVAVVQLGQQRDDAAVHLAAHRRIADVGMNRIGEIDRCRPPRQRDQPALRREAEDLVVEQLELGVLQELLGAVAFRQRLHGAAQPLIGPALAGQRGFVAAATVLVERMGRDAVFGDPVHLLGADLQFDALAARADHGGVQRAIVVLLGRRDVVLEPPRHARPGGVDDAEHRVAGGARRRP